MALYDYKCPTCGQVTEISRPMQSTGGTYFCPKCQVAMARVYEFPHTELNWKAYDRNDTGFDRMVLRTAKPGVRSLLNDATDRQAKVHDDTRQEGRYG